MDNDKLILAYERAMENRAAEEGLQDDPDEDLYEAEDWLEKWEYEGD